MFLKTEIPDLKIFDQINNIARDISLVNNRFGMEFTGEDRLALNQIPPVIESLENYQ